MAFEVKVKSCRATAEKSPDPNYSIVAVLEKPLLDMRTGAIIEKVCYGHEEADMEEAISEIGANNVRKILLDGEKAECNVDVEYHDWK